MPTPSIQPRGCPSKTGSGEPATGSALAFPKENPGAATNPSADEHARDLERIASIASDLATAQNEDAAFRIVLDAALDSTGRTEGMVLIWEDGGVGGRVAASMGLDDEFVRAVSARLTTPAAKPAKDVASLGLTAANVLEQFVTALRIPIGAKGREPMGELAVFYSTIPAPSLRAARWLEVLSQLAAGYITQDRSRAAGSRLAAIIESSDDAIISKDLNGVITSWNAGAEELFGYTAAEAIGRSVTMLIPPEYHDEEPNILERVRSGERIRHYETVRRRKDGTLVDVSLTVSPVRDSGGQIIGASKVGRDISERKQADDAVRQLAAIVESSDDAIISKQLDGTITSWNAAAQRLFGYTAAEMIGQPVTTLIPEGRPDEEPGIIERIRRGERIEHYETVRRRKDGTLVDVSITVSPLRGTNGHVIGASKIARDISAQKKTEAELRRLHEQALAAVRAKDDFLAALSHELRTPLNPVLLLASNAAEDPTVPEHLRRDFLTIRKNVELEARLIDDLLDLTRITRGKLLLSIAPQDAHATLEDVLSMLAPDFVQKQLAVTRIFAPGRPLVLADAVRLRQIIWNVIKNALKFTPEGGQVSVRTAVADGKLRISILDTGIGMTPAELGRVFDAFEQGDHASRASSHQFGGLGLGLTISRMLVELQHGEIRAESGGANQGATFEIELPLTCSGPGAGNPTTPATGARSPAPAAGATLPAEAGSRRRILLVEDHEATRMALRHLLTRRNFDVLAAGSVAAALALAEKSEFDLLISDIGLPDGDGYELMTRLRHRSGLKGIALTGYGMERDVERGAAAGFTTHLTKPVTVQALDEALAFCLPVAPDPVPPDAGASP